MNQQDVIVITNVLWLLFMLFFVCYLFLPEDWVVVHTIGIDCELAQKSLKQLCLTVVISHNEKERSLWFKNIISKHDYFLFYFLREVLVLCLHNISINTDRVVLFCFVILCMHGITLEISNLVILVAGRLALSLFILCTILAFYFAPKGVLLELSSDGPSGHKIVYM